MLDPTEFRNIVSGKRGDLAARLIRPCLSFAEIPYRAAVRFRNYRFDTKESLTHSVHAPVISIGNLTMGGTGKTPLVCWLANWFLGKGIRVAIVSRGYGAENGKKNDEAIELAQRLPNVPHVQNPNRVAAASQAIQEHAAQVILLDDGFQHRRIARNLNVVLVDSTDPFGCDHVFPRGLLREPIEGIGRAQVICLTRTDHVTEERLDQIEKRYRSFNQNALYLRLAHRAREWINSRGKRQPLDRTVRPRVAALCALGNPNAFKTTLESCGCAVEYFQAFPDHHHFSIAEIETFRKRISKLPIDFVACSHKDLVKIDQPQLGEFDLFALQIDIDFVSDGTAFVEKLQQIVQGIADGAQAETGYCDL